MIHVKKGLDIPVTGAPVQKEERGNRVSSVAVVGPDYNGMKPAMKVKTGDRVKLGQILFSDKKTPGVNYTAPGAGVVTAIKRGHKRSFLSVAIELDGDEEERFEFWDSGELENLKREQIVENLVLSGLWTSFRTRPYSKVPSPDSKPRSIFVTAMDTNPLAADPEVYIYEEHNKAFIDGLKVISGLTEGKVYVCKAPDVRIPRTSTKNVFTEEFKGKHPAGLPGSHIHFLDPVSYSGTVWYLNYQDLIAIGKLFVTGRLFVDRMISLAGPRVIRPRLIRTRIGANIDDLVEGELRKSPDEDNRVISGSILSGRESVAGLNFLGRYHLQISVLEEGRKRHFLGWLSPGLNKFSVKNVFMSKLLPRKKFNFTCSQEGSERAMVPIGSYEKVMPFDTQPTFLLRALITGDTDMAQALGCLELDEEDLALCTFVCPGKYDYGTILF